MFVSRKRGFRRHGNSIWDRKLCSMYGFLWPQQRGSYRRRGMSPVVGFMHLYNLSNVCTCSQLIKYIYIHMCLIRLNWEWLHINIAMPSAPKCFRISHVHTYMYHVRTYMYHVHTYMSHVHTYMYHVHTYMHHLLSHKIVPIISTFFQKPMTMICMKV